MNIIKRKSEFPSVFDEVDDLFQGFFRPVAQTNLTDNSTHYPAVDIGETDSDYLLIAELPGFDKEDIKVSFHDGKLMLKAEHKEESETKKEEGSVIKERRFGQFFRGFNFGNNIKEGEITAKYEKGLLELTIPKSTESKAQEKHIEIK